MENPTIVVLTDRNDLDDQTLRTFARCKDLLRQPPVQAADRTDLRDKLSVASGGVVSLQSRILSRREKSDHHPILSDRRNIVVIADEAHRSQYDFIDAFARHMRDALPNASFIGFTGTPIEKTDANTRAVFETTSASTTSSGVIDGATVPIYYESRLAKLALMESERPKIDPQLRKRPRGRDRAQGKAQEPGLNSSPWSDRIPDQVDRVRPGGALLKLASRHGRQGDVGMHEPPHLRRAVSRDRGATPGMESRRRRPGRAQGGDDRLGIRSS